jgi:hypothetical protein
MTSTVIGQSQRGRQLVIWGWLILQGLVIWLDRRSPGSSTARLAHWAMTIYFFVWFGSLIRRGYLRRHPYWTRESWLRYLRLAWMPVAAVALFLGLVYANDLRPSLFGPAESTARLLSIAVDLTLMLFGVIGIVMAIGWLTDGEPSAQFTRTRWFRGRRTT